MKKIFVVIIVCFIVIFSGCNKKQSSDEIKVKKNNSHGTENLTSQSKDSSENKSSSVSSELKTISSKEVKQHIGDSLNIEGYVADIYLSDKVAYLNFENKFPKNILTATIFSGKMEEFGDLSKFKNRKVVVTGKITSYKNKPQVVLNTKDQIKVIN